MIVRQKKFILFQYVSKITRFIIFTRLIQLIKAKLFSYRKILIMALNFFIYYFFFEWFHLGFEKKMVSF